MIHKPTDPFNKFELWFKEACEKEQSYPESFSLATLNLKTLEPSTRIVLLKFYSEKGFIFYTNYNSQKAMEIRENPKVEMLFHWKSMCKQVRIQGTVTKISSEKSDQYWNSRSYESQMYGLISDQSSVINLTPDELEKKTETLKRKFPHEIPRPAHWGGFLISPHRFEFWSEGKDRWHSREIFLREKPNQQWIPKRLYP